MSSQYLWCNVVWCTTEGGGGVPRTETLLAHAIISELHMTVLVQQHVVQLQITVDNAWEEREGREKRTKRRENTVCLDPLFL